MLAQYQDIKKRIKEAPRWFDENGVPRYDEFHPSLSPNIYADEVVLMEISCQDCGRRFFVEMSWSTSFGILDGIVPLHKRIEDKLIHYGDPPNDCCDCGATMNCNDLEIIQFWSRDKFEWERNKKYEIVLTIE